MLALVSTNNTQARRSLHTARLDMDSVKNKLALSQGGHETAADFLQLEQKRETATAAFHNQREKVAICAMPLACHHN